MCAAHSHAWICVYITPSNSIITRFFVFLKGQTARFVYSHQSNLIKLQDQKVVNTNEPSDAAVPASVSICVCKIAKSIFPTNIAQ